MSILFTIAQRAPSVGVMIGFFNDLAYGYIVSRKKIKTTFNYRGIILDNTVLIKIKMFFNFYFLGYWEK